MKHGTLAVGGTKELVPRASGMLDYFNPAKSNAYYRLKNTKFKHDGEHSSKHVAYAYEVLMKGVPKTSMDLSNRSAMLLVAQELINCNGLLKPSLPTIDHISYLHWQNTKSKVESIGDVCIGFTSVKLVRKGFQ